MKKTTRYCKENKGYKKKDVVWSSNEILFQGRKTIRLGEKGVKSHFFVFIRALYYQTISNLSNVLDIIAQILIFFFFLIPRNFICLT